MPQNYVPIFIFLGVIAVLLPLTLLAAKLVRPDNPNRTKLMPYECGIDPVGSARERAVHGCGGGVAIWGQGKYWEIRDTPFTVKEAVGPAADSEAAPADSEHVEIRRAIFGA